MINFTLSSTQPLSRMLITLGIFDFKEAVSHVHQLPYGRNSDRSNYLLLLNEQRGTCATKHAFLRQVAIENNQDAVQLYLGIYEMNEDNTSGIGKVLEDTNLSCIPEAHTYLKINDTIVDITKASNKEATFTARIIEERTIEPYQIGDDKVQWHQAYLKKWIIEKDINYSFEAIWHIRENCILALSKS